MNSDDRLPVNLDDDTGLILAEDIARLAEQVHYLEDEMNDLLRRHDPVILVRAPLTQARDCLGAAEVLMNVGKRRVQQ